MLPSVFAAGGNRREHVSSDEELFARRYSPGWDVWGYDVVVDLDMSGS